MLTIDGTTTAKPAAHDARMEMTLEEIKAAMAKSAKPDDGIPAELRRVPPATAAFHLPQAPKPAPLPLPPLPAPDIGAAPQPSAAGGMIFLRRTGEHKHWVVQFIGLPKLPQGGELPVPVECNATLRDVLTWLHTTHNGKLGGAWLLVAP